jgi:hypothetical protein
MSLGWLAESGIKSGEWLYRPEESSQGFQNVTISTFNVTSNSISSTTTLVPVTINNDILLKSAFSHFYQMDKIDALKVFFATVFPIVLIIFMFLSLTNALNYILASCKLDFLQMGTIFVNKEQLEEGKKKLERYRKVT